MWTEVSRCTNRAMGVTAWSESLHLTSCIGSWVNETSSYEFYVRGSVHRWSTLITLQRDAKQSSLFIILHVNSTCFGSQPHPSSGVHKTVTTASGTVQPSPSNVAKVVSGAHKTVTTASGAGHIVLCSYLPPTWPSLATLERDSWTVPEAVVTVLCTPDDGCVWHPKHLEWTCWIINRILCVASRWTVINI